MRWLPKAVGPSMVLRWGGGGGEGDWGIGIAGVGARVGLSSIDLSCCGSWDGSGGICMFGVK